MLKTIAIELRKHSPFTASGVITGIIILVFSYNFSRDLSYNVFYVLHPLHVLLSSFTTASMYILHTQGSKKSKILSIILIGYFGSIGIATISDSLVPYLGELLLDLPNRGIHLGFIEEWYIVNPVALLGILVAYFKPTTKFPHAGHVLLSTWASTFHVILALGAIRTWYLYFVIFIFLFIAVWIPCCASDIVFPLIFAKLKDKNKKALSK